MNYNKYYEARNIPKFSLAEVDINNPAPAVEALFSDTLVNLVHSEIALKNDLETLKMIANGTYAVKTFDYDGEKYKKSAAATLVKKLKEEVAQHTQALLENDKNVYAFFKNKENKKGGQQLDGLYAKFFAYDEVFDGKYQLFADMHEKLQFINFTTPFEEIQANFRHLTSLERRLKSEITLILEDPMYASELTTPIKANFDEYLSQEWQYFGKQTYFENNLNILFDALNNYSQMLSRGYFIHKKALLDYQESLL